MNIEKWKSSISNLNMEIVSQNRAKMIYSFLPSLDEAILLHLIF